MRTRASKALPLLCVLLALAIGIASWSALREKSSTGVDVPSPAGVDVLHSTRTDERAPLTALPEPSQIVPASELPPVAKDAKRVTVATTAELELADAIWISGRLVFPEGTPLGEQIDVIANGREFKSREMHRARVEANGNFRVAFATNTRSGQILIDAPHLFLPEPLNVKIKDGKSVREVLVEPKLGGCVLGQLRLPPQVQSVAAELVGKRVTSWGNSHLGGDRLSGSDCDRSALVDSKLRFELRGLDPEAEHRVRFDSGVVADATLPAFKIEAGATKQIDLVLSLGAHLRGRVKFQGAEEPSTMRLYCKSERLNAMPGSIESRNGNDSDIVTDPISLANDGSFDARGIVAGQITLQADGPQRIAARLDLGAVGDGELREGLELVLGLGEQISGRVLWPDGAPAIGADIGLEIIGDQELPPLGGVVTDAKGEFLITGLEPGHLKLTAKAKAREAPEKSKARAATWKAEIEDVAVGTRDLEITLRGGYSITGVVVDDLGAPIESFRVSAKPVDANQYDTSKLVSAKFSSVDGRFELGGLFEGAHTLEVSMLTHEPPESIRIEVPAESGPFRFVAMRNASISGLVSLPDGSPAARAILDVRGQSQMNDAAFGHRANAQGEFKLTRVHSGTVELRAMLAGYASSEPFPLELAAGQEMEGVRLILRRGARITGEVLPSRDGETISNRNLRGNNKQGSNYLSSSTDSKGRFSFENVDPGEYTITLQPSPEELQSLKRPGVSSDDQRWELEQALAKTATAKVELGGEAHVIFGASERPTIRITGTVRRGESPLEFTRVRALPAGPADARGANFALTDGSGRFEIAVVQAGKYQLEAMLGGMSKNDGGLVLIQESIPVGSVFDVPAGGLEGVVVSIPSGRIAGRVHAQAGSSTGRIRVTLEKNERDRARSSRDVDAWPDAQFEFEDLAPGKYTLVASAWVPDSSGRPRKVLAPVRETVELTESQDLGDLMIVIEEH